MVGNWHTTSCTINTPAAAAHCVVDKQLRATGVAAVAIGLVSFSTDTAYDYEHRRVVVCIWGKVVVWPGCPHVHTHTQWRLKATGESGGRQPHCCIAKSANWCEPDFPPTLCSPQKIVRHSAYNTKNSANDIALLVLDKPARATLAALAPANFKLPTGNNVQYLFAAGWGATEYESMSMDLL